MIQDHVQVPEESRPSTIFYSAQGEKKEIVVSDRSSYQAGDAFVLLSRISVLPRQRGKEAERSNKNPPLLVEEVEDESVAQARAKPNAADWNRSATGRGNMGVGIQYKDQTSFFVPCSPEGSAPAVFVPGPELPNAIYRMASSRPYEFEPGESISQARCPLSDVQEVEEGSSSICHQSRDTPPHFGLTDGLARRDQSLSAPREREGRASSVTRGRQYGSGSTGRGHSLLLNKGAGSDREAAEGEQMGTPRTTEMTRAMDRMATVEGEEDQGAPIPRDVLGTDHPALLILEHRVLQEAMVEEEEEDRAAMAEGVEAQGMDQ
ncbi:hypothetical protein K438DRAFT_2176708 [Mycena galopus ATCC 62051]|nr:hypothetical protein K438DRAFT_2176708 [Mycena galopus ATCC 62051]